MLIQNRKPESVFRYFEEISRIPRESGNERGIADYLVNFAITHGLEYRRDALHNVLIRMPASEGFESQPSILFQGHTDMVCVKEKGSDHDFSKDPLELRTDGKVLWANQTTLGADDGIGVALMLSLLSGEVSEHPTLECLFTVQEEIGLIGANNLIDSWTHSNRIVNLDSENIDELIAGCCGGIRSDLVGQFPLVPLNGSVLRISIEGLQGGHSGEDIDKNRLNANVLLSDLLSILRQKAEFGLISASGGTKDNAIPADAVALLAVPDAELANAVLSDWLEEHSPDFLTHEKNLRIEISEMTETDACEMISPKATGSLISFLQELPNGVQTRNAELNGMPESSCNFGIMRLSEADGKMQITVSFRSSEEEQLNGFRKKMEQLASAFGFVCSFRGKYPGWEYRTVSPLRDAYAESYHRITGKELKIAVIHAGLECGIFASRNPDCDIISVGPSLENVHSPSERLDLASVETAFLLIRDLLKKKF